MNAEEQTAIFTFDQSIPTGPDQLGLDDTGKIGTQAAGLFALDYDSPTRHKRSLYAQFENSGARVLSLHGMSLRTRRRSRLQHPFPAP